MRDSAAVNSRAFPRIKQFGNSLFRNFRGKRRQFRTDRFCKRNMRDDSVSEEGVRGALFCPVVKLVDHDDVARRIPFLEASDRGKAEDMRHSEIFQRIDVRPVVDFRRRDDMSLSVP